MINQVNYIFFKEFPEEPVDNRCLYDKLEEQRLKKEEEHNEKIAFSEC